MPRNHKTRIIPITDQNIFHPLGFHPGPRVERAAALTRLQFTRHVSIIRLLATVFCSIVDNDEKIRTAAGNLINNQTISVRIIGESLLFDYEKAILTRS
jgi:hypothetical protein